MFIKNKTSFFAGLTAVFVSATLVVVAVYAATTVGNSVTVGGNLTVSGNATLATSTLSKLTVTGPLVIPEGALTDSSVVSADIKDGTIVNADISPSAAIAYGKLNLTGSITNGDLAGSIALSKLATTTAGNIIVSNASNVPTYVTMSGDATIDNTGVLTISNGAVTSAKIADGAIVDADVSPSAAIAYGKLNLTGSITNGDLAGSIALSKLATTTAGNIIVSNASNVPTYVTMSGDATIDNTGVLTISNGAVTSAKIADGAIVDADVSPSAAIAGSKINPDFGAQNIQTTGTLTIGGGTAISEHLSATSSVLFNLDTANTCTVATTSISGAAVGDTVSLGMPEPPTNAYLNSWGGWISSAGVASLKYCTGNTTTTDASYTVRIDVWKH